MRFFKKHNSISKISIFSILLFLESFKISYGGFLYWGLEKILSGIANTMLYISAQILVIAGILFNLTLKHTLKFKELVTRIGVVNIGWEIIRYLSNMIFYFHIIVLSYRNYFRIRKWISL